MATTQSKFTKFGLCTANTSTKYGLSTIYDDCGLRVASLNFKDGLRTVTIKFGEFGLNTIATHLKTSDSGPYVTATLLRFCTIGSCTIAASFKGGLRTTRA